MVAVSDGEECPNFNSLVDMTHRVGAIPFTLYYLC